MITIENIGEEFHRLIHLIINEKVKFINAPEDIENCYESCSRYSCGFSLLNNNDLGFSLKEFSIKYLYKRAEEFSEFILSKNSRFILSYNIGDELNKKSKSIILNKNGLQIGIMQMYDNVDISCTIDMEMVLSLIIPGTSNWFSDYKDGRTLYILLECKGEYGEREIYYLGPLNLPDNEIIEKCRQILKQEDCRNQCDDEILSKINCIRGGEIWEKYKKYLSKKYGNPTPDFRRINV